MTGFVDYDRWKTTEPDDSSHEIICDKCGGNLRRKWPYGWICERCDQENEYRERQIAEQEDEWSHFSC